MSSNVSTKLPNFKSYPLIKQILRRFKEKEREVVILRFGLTNENPKTLEAIGKKYGITRERVRQIEKNSLNKFFNPAVLSKIEPSINHIVRITKQAGGIMSEEELISKLFSINKINYANLGAFNIYLRLNDKLSKTKPTKKLKSFIISKGSPNKLVEKIADEYIEILHKAQKVMSSKELIINFRKSDIYAKNKKNISSKLLLSVINIADKILKTKNGRLGLKSWPSINPRNTRDKIYYIFKENKKPLYFRDLTAKIAEKNFVGKAPAAATVHNELISDNRYVLIGKGIYALREWGFSDGTVADVITEILKKNKSGIGQDKIIEYVLKVRHVNKNTVIMNLQNKKEFIRANNGSDWKLAKK